jgi:hypothetical protein
VHTEHVTRLLQVDVDKHAHLDQMDDHVQLQPASPRQLVPRCEGVGEIRPSHVKFARFHFSRTHDDASLRGTGNDKRNSEGCR